jgi:hypothetical protein|tara:strand:+ start:78 stop:299 length:222 start_codon:yes stop_codon:yes gene_type:complete
MADNPKTLYEIACEAHEKAFGCEPVYWGFQRWNIDDVDNDEPAKSILAAIIEGVPYDERPEGYDPKNPHHFVG